MHDADARGTTLSPAASPGPPSAIKTYRRRGPEAEDSPLAEGDAPPASPSLFDMEIREWRPTGTCTSSGGGGGGRLAPPDKTSAQIQTNMF